MGIDYDPDTDTFFTPEHFQSFGSQGGSGETDEDDEDKDTGDLEGEDEDGEMDDFPALKKT